MRNIFVEISCTKCDGETIHRCFSKKSKLTTSLAGSITIFFIVCQVESYLNILKLSCRPLAFTSFKAFFFLKKRGLELVSLPHFLHDFENKYLSRCILLTDQISLPDSLYLVRYLMVPFPLLSGQYVYCNCL